MPPLMLSIMVGFKGPLCTVLPCVVHVLRRVGWKDVVALIPSLRYETHNVASSSRLSGLRGPEITYFMKGWSHSAYIIGVCLGGITICRVQRNIKVLQLDPVTESAGVSNQFTGVVKLNTVWRFKWRCE